MNMGRRKAPRKHGMRATRRNSSTAKSMFWSGTIAAAKSRSGAAAQKSAIQSL